MLEKWSVETCQKIGLAKLADRLAVVWNPRMRTTAGRAWWPDCIIELNPKLKEFAPEEPWRTLKHELAHLVAYERFGRRKIQPHGPEWRAACDDLGIPGELRCHRLPFALRRLQRKHAYTCPRCRKTAHRVRAIRGPAACHDCCRRFNGGRYHEDFRLICAVAP
ncbi:MAG: SprT-like domain-containing protein [Verrucomicrobiota bacterium]